jgi:hypothetical protein
VSLDRHFEQGPMFGCTDPRCCGVYPPEDTDHCPECMVEWPCEVELLRQRAKMAELGLEDLAEEVDRQRERAERAEAALARQRPVIEAALAWSQDLPSASKCDGVLMRAVIAYRERAERAEAELGKLCPHRTSESNGSYWVCCSCGEYLRKANQ